MGELVELKKIRTPDKIRAVISHNQFLETYIIMCKAHGFSRTMDGLTRAWQNSLEDEKS